MKKKIQWITTGVFVGFIGIFTVLNILYPSRAFSENENRVLAQAPEVSLKHVFSGNFDEEYEKYFSDQFIFRDEWMSVKAALKIGTGSIENNGIYFGAKDQLFAMHASYDEKILNQNIQMIQRFSETIHKAVNVMVIPSSSYIDQSALPSFAYTIDEGTLIDSIQKELSSQNWIDVKGRLLEGSKEKELYFSTDHHWNAYGAQVGYTAICEDVLQSEPKEYTIEEVAEGFKGTLYSKAGAFWIKGDPIYSIEPTSPIQLEVSYEGNTYDTLYAPEKLETKDKYTYYLGGNHPLVEIHTDNPNGKTAVVVKDSYAHILTPYLVSEYSEIIEVDLRYYRNAVSDFIRDIDNTDVYFIYSLENLTSDSNMVFLK